MYIYINIYIYIYIYTRICVHATRALDSLAMRAGTARRSLTFHDAVRSLERQRQCLTLSAHTRGRGGHGGSNNVAAYEQKMEGQPQVAIGSTRTSTQQPGAQLTTAHMYNLACAMQGSTRTCCKQRACITVTLVPSQPFRLSWVSAGGGQVYGEVPSSSKRRRRCTGH